MNKELLSILVPKSASLEMSSHGHDSITPEDVNMILSYANLDSEEYNFLLMKFVNETGSENMFYKSILKYYKSQYMDIHIDDLSKLVNLAILECCNPTCMICNGTGTIITMNSLSVCPHCTDGVFDFTDDVRPQLLKMNRSTYKLYQDRLEKMIEHIRNIETSALSKIGDDS